MALYKNKYRIESARLKDWNYSSPGWYFVTICTKGMRCYFGEILDGKMERNEIGEYAYNCWFDIPKHFINVLLDEFVIMPNHVHGIIIINEITKNHGRDVACNVSTTMVTTKPKQSIISPKKCSLGTIIRSFKSAVTNWCNKNGFSDFTWQSRYHEHIIRNEKSLKMIRRYIKNNPQKCGYENNTEENLNLID